MTILNEIDLTLIHDAMEAIQIEIGLDDEVTCKACGGRIVFQYSVVAGFDMRTKDFYCEILDPECTEALRDVFHKTTARLMHTGRYPREINIWCVFTTLKVCSQLPSTSREEMN